MIKQELKHIFKKFNHFTFSPSHFKSISQTFKIKRGSSNDTLLYVTNVIKKKNQHVNHTPVTQTYSFIRKASKESSTESEESHTCPGI